MLTLKLVWSRLIRRTPALPFRPITDYTKTYTSKLESLKVDKSKLSEFFKAVHPDLFGSAPPEYRTNNSRSMQELNHYINSLEQNAGVSYTKLEFYVKLRGESVDDPENYSKQTLELLPIKPKSSPDLLKMHIKGVIDTLNAAISPVKTQGTVKMGTKDVFTATPMKQQKMIEELAKMKEEIIIKTLGEIMPFKRSKDKVMRKIYNTLYNLPKNLPLRKPDPMLSYLINTTTNMESLNSMMENSLDPSFVFFDNSLSEKQINEFLKRLNGWNLPKESRFKETYELKQLSHELYENDPPVYFIISKEYSIDKMDGFIAIPYNFDIKALIDYYHVNKGEVQQKAKKIIEKYSPAIKTKWNIEQSFRLKIAEVPINEKYWRNYIIALKHLEKLLKDDGWIRLKMEGMKLVFGEEYRKKKEDDLIEIPFFFNNDKLKDLLAK